MAKLSRVGKQMTDAILTVLKYVRDTTGIEPSQKEIANALKSYFILNEIGNQIRFQRNNPIAQDQPETSSKDPFWKLNLAKSSIDSDIYPVLNSVRIVNLSDKA